MSNIRTYTRSFNGGELTPEFFGQVTDSKYQTGLALAENFDVLPHGPVVNRAGTTYVRTAKTPAKRTFVRPFTFSTTQTMVLELGESYFRFHTNGATLLAPSATAWSSATAYTLGNLVSRLGVTYYCILAHTNQQPPNATYWYPLPATGEYEIPTPYAEADLADIHYVQSADVLTLVHPNYAPRELRRYGATDWRLEVIQFASTLSAPTGVSATNTVGTGATTYTYRVSAVDSTGLEESLASSSASCTNNLLTSGNRNTVSWSSVAGASRYNVYKQFNGLFGYIGQTDSTSFVDENIEADVGKTPPIQNLPFATDFPQAVSYYEQRRCFAGTTAKPQNFWMTRSGTESNLSSSIPTRADDAIAFRVAAREANTIRHMVPLRELLLLTSSAEWVVTSVNSDSITPTTTAVRPQSYIGASNVQPLIINNSLLFAAARGGHIRELGYSDTVNGYLTGDLSLRAPHLFDGYQITDMTYAKAPYPMAFSSSTSNKLIGLTYVPEQQVAAMFRRSTRTKAGESVFESCCAVAEGAEDVVYAVVRRVINGATTRYIERFASRFFAALEDAFFVDSGVTFFTPKTITNATKANPVVITSNTHGFSNGDFVDIRDVGGMTQLNGKRYIVSDATSNTFALKDENGNYVNGTTYSTYTSGGTAARAVSTLTGLDWLEGETVNILCNGAVHPQRAVTGGAITLDNRSSKIHVGLPIVADMQSLPLAFEAQGFGQGRQKNVNKVWLRVYRSSGIFVGPSFDKLTEVKQRTFEPYGSPPALKTEEVSVVVSPSWNDNGQVCIRQLDPLPLTVSAMTLEVSIGG